MDPKLKQYNKLKALWQKKLADSGFEDIEQSDGNLKEWAQKLRSKGLRTNRETNEEYYRYAGHFLHDYTFKNELDKLVWMKHSEGLSNRNIVKYLKEIRAYKGRDRIDLIVKNLKGEMIKFYGIDGKNRIGNN